MRLSLFGALIALPLPILAADIDRGIADFRTPAEIRWVRNPAGTNGARHRHAGRTQVS